MAFKVNKISLIGQVLDLLLVNKFLNALTTTVCGQICAIPLRTKLAIFLKTYSIICQMT